MAQRWGGIEVVIWDFNGTILDDLDLCVRSVNAQLGRRDLPKLTIERYRDVFAFPVADYYRRIGLNPDAEPMRDLSAEFFATYAPGLSTCPLHDGARTTLTALRDAGVQQFVLSAMEQGLLETTLKALGISGVFDAVYGLAHHEGDSKLTRGQELLAEQDIRPASALLIGDTDHDGEVAEALGLAVALVARGHQSEARLRATAHPVFADLESLRRELSISRGSSLPTPRLDHVAVEVADVDRAIGFYTEKLGFTLTSNAVNDEQQEAYAFLRGEDVSLELISDLTKTYEVAPSPVRPYCPHICFVTDDMDRTLEMLKANGIPVLHGPLRVEGEETWVYFADPDGNVLEYIQWLK